MRELLEGEDRPGLTFRPPFEVELPLIAVRVRRDHRETVERIPMFRGYLFPRFDRDADPWQLIRQMDDVLQLFMTRSLTPIPLPVGFVEELIDGAGSRLKLPTLKLPTFDVGQILRVELGPFAAFQAVCLECDGLNTRVDVQIFGRSTEIAMPRAWLRLHHESRQHA